MSTICDLGESITIIDDFLYITSHRNRGAAWGILEGQMWFFYIITVIVIIAIIYYMQKGKRRRCSYLNCHLAFMLGGAIGNFIDRVLRQEVVDFIHTYPFGYNFPIFNIADSALSRWCCSINDLYAEEKREKTKEKSNAESGTHRS